MNRLTVSENGRYLMTDDGKPFFWLGDTGWAVFNSLTMDEVTHYFSVRASQRFNVIQVFMIADWMPNIYGHLPFIDGDPTQPNPAFLDHAAAIIDLAECHGLYIMLCVGEVIRVKKPWMKKGSSYLICEPDRAYEYGRALGARLGEKKNLIWSTGQDYDTYNDSEQSVVRAIAKGIADGTVGRNNPEGPTDYSCVSMTFHPSGNGMKPNSSGQWYHEDSWLHFNMTQSAHHRTHILQECYETIEEDYRRSPAKPVLDGEACYENHEVLEMKGTGEVFTAHDVRRPAYWTVFAGACGHTYGCSEVYPMKRASDSQTPDGTETARSWQEALNSPGATQMQFLRDLIESRPFLTRIPDQSIVTSPIGDKLRHVRATRDQNGSYAFIYIPDSGREIAVDFAKLSGSRWNTWWYDPRTGRSELIDSSSEAGIRRFTAPPSGPDWVLVIDDAGRNFPQPGCSCDTLLA